MKQINEVDEKLPLRQNLLLGLQHTVIAVLAAITVPLLIAANTGLSAEQTSFAVPYPTKRNKSPPGKAAKQRSKSSAAFLSAAFSCEGGSGKDGLLLPPAKIGADRFAVLALGLENRNLLEGILGWKILPAEGKETA